MDKHTNSRRRVLKSIAAGSGAVITGKSLPETWTRPVIDTVMLPAHATTTDDSGSAGSAVTTPPPCADSLVIPGDTVSCGDGETVLYRYYYVDDTGSCPELVPTTKGGAPSPADTLVVEVEALSEAAVIEPTRLWVALGVNDDKPTYMEQLCGDPWEAYQYPSNTLFKARSGASWNASFTLSRNGSIPGQASISNITLTPAV